MLLWPVALEFGICPKERVETAFFQLCGKRASDTRSQVNWVSTVSHTAEAKTCVANRAEIKLRAQIRKSGYISLPDRTSDNNVWSSSNHLDPFRPFRIQRFALNRATQKMIFLEPGRCGNPLAPQTNSLFRWVGKMYSVLHLFIESHDFLGKAVAASSNSPLSARGSKESLRDMAKLPWAASLQTESLHPVRALKKTGVEKLPKQTGPLRTNFL